MATPKEQSIREEASALGDRAAGAVKDKAGEVFDDPALERRGEEQNAAGRARQEANRETDTTATGQRYVTTFYEDPTEASRAYDRLRSREYRADDIDVVMS